MKSKLCFAMVAATLAAAPLTATVALAQGSTAPTYQNDASRGPQSQSSSSSGPTDSPAVQSLPGVDPEPWRDDRATRATNRSLDRRDMDRRAMNQKSMDHNTMQRDRMSGSTGGATMDQDATGSSNRSMRRDPDLSSRRGRGQNDLELSQTTLLNQFSAAGYSMVRDFRKTGDRYVAQAQDKDGRWSTVELDPRSGTITPR